jgi:hypothetical protein
MTPENSKEKPSPGAGPLRMTRRRLLGSAARLAALAAASSILPPNLRRALAQEPPRQGSLRDIKHVVMLMQENRSFDHYFGTLAGVRGFDDPNALILPNGKPVFYQPIRKTRAVICCRFIWTPARRARRKFLRPAIRGRASTAPGTGARWTTGCRRIAKWRARRRLM